MAQVTTDALRLVIGNVFAKGESFPGFQEVVTFMVHELVHRWPSYWEQHRADLKEAFCIHVTALHLIMELS